MHPDTTSGWFSRLLWRGKALAVMGVLILLFTGASGCSSLRIPTAETAPVETTVTAQSVDATALPGTAGTTQPAAADSQPPAAAVAVPKSAVKLIPATVVRVVDGDTAVFHLAGGADEKVRFIGVNTPESTTRIEPYGKAASAYTAEHLSVGMTVYLEKDVEPRDRYGRLLAYVWLMPPTAINESELRAKLFNAQLAIDGYAQQMTIPPDVKYADYFRSFVAEARSSGRGLWSGRSESGTSGSAAAAGVAAGAAGPSAGSRLSAAAYIPAARSPR